MIFFLNVVSIIKSVKSVLCLKVEGNEEPSVAPTDDISNKTTFYLEAIQNTGITQKNPEEMIEFETAPCPPDTFHSNWAQYPGNYQFELKPEVTNEIQKLYMRVKGWG